MEKSLKALIGIIIGVIILYGIIFLIDYSKCSHMKMPIFVIEDDGIYYGLGYRVQVEKCEEELTKVEMYMFGKFITGAISDITIETEKVTNSKNTRVVMVNGKLYYDTRKESNELRCGMMDGKITSNVEKDKIPTEDNQSNFEGEYGYQYGKENTIEVNINDKWYIFTSEIGSIRNVLTIEDKIQDDAIWCGTFQLIWNDLKNDLAKQDIVFKPQLKVVENLNKETFTTNDLADKYYYKKYEVPTLELKKEIEQAIKDKFNETSDILDDFDWDNATDGDLFLYIMLKKEFEFEIAFEELENAKFGDYDNIEYFGIKENNKNDELRHQVNVLYYNSKDDFAIKLKTKQEDEVIFCKKPTGDTFNEIYENIVKNQEQYKGSKSLHEGELLKIPNIDIKQKTEFVELENKVFSFSDGREYSIEKALQTIQFKLDKKGGKVKSEAGIMNKLASAIEPDQEIREFAIDDTFAIFLIETGKEKPYFAGKISDITKFQ